MQSMAVATACFAARSFFPFIEPETSMIKSSDRSWAAPVPSAVTVRTACITPARPGKELVLEAFDVEVGHCGYSCSQRVVGLGEPRNETTATVMLS